MRVIINLNSRRILYKKNTVSGLMPLRRKLSYHLGRTENQFGNGKDCNAWATGKPSMILIMPAYWKSTAYTFSLKVEQAIPEEATMDVYLTAVINIHRHFCANKI